MNINGMNRDQYAERLQYLRRIADGMIRAIETAADIVQTDDAQRMTELYDIMERLHDDAETMATQTDLLGRNADQIEELKRKDDYENFTAVYEFDQAIEHHREQLQRLGATLEDDVCNVLRKMLSRLTIQNKIKLLRHVDETTPTR